MMQQWIFPGFALAALLAGAAPFADPCAAVHVADAGVAHTPDGDVEPWLDPATAELLAAAPRIEHRLGNDGAIVDLAIPESLLLEPEARCR